MSKKMIQKNNTGHYVFLDGERFSNAKLEIAKCVPVLWDIANGVLSIGSMARGMYDPHGVSMVENKVDGIDFLCRILHNKLSDIGCDLMDNVDELKNSVSTGVPPLESPKEQAADAKTA